MAWRSILIQFNLIYLKLIIYINISIAFICILVIAFIVFLVLVHQSF